MLKLLSKWLKIYQDEINLFFWSAVLLFLIRSSNILFNNFAETAFLKRFGVQYLPIITAVNSVTTFFIMGFLAGFMVRLPGSRLLEYTLVFCGISVAGLRFLIPLDFDLLYPILYVLKTQYEVLLGFLFWNLANDLFNTRQSKRIFPLITAGGIIGGIIGSFGTPLLAKTISINNLMFAYLGTTVVGALALKRMGTLFPSVLLFTQEGKKKKSRASFIGEIKGVLPLIKESKLAKILILLTLLPNIVIPIINYQFNFAVDQRYATESGMLGFFAYFRGAQNVIALIISLFVGRIYGRFGLPVALLFHPFNYMLAFLGFLFRFDIFSAMYARLSTAVLRTAINTPARAVLFGLFPESYRHVIRTFLRGTVVRVGVLMGSGFVLLSQGFMHPRYLSLVALVFVTAWIGSTFFLKRDYSKILLDLIERDMLDLKALDAQDAVQIFKDKKMHSQLLRSFSSARGEDSLWYGRLLKSLEVKGLDARILSKLKEEDDRTRIRLLPLLSSQAGKEAVQVFLDLVDPHKPDLMVAFARTAKRVYEDMPSDLQKEIFETARNPEVKAYMVVGLYGQAPLEYKGTIDAWLNSDHLPERRAGVLAAGESEDCNYITKLVVMLQKEEDESIIPLILKALSRLGAPEINELALPFLSHPLETARLAALDTFEIESDDTARKVIGLMGDPSEKVRDLAMEKLETSSYEINPLLAESLVLLSRRIRNGIFQLAESLGIKDMDAFQFSRSQLEMGYRNLAEAEALGHLPESRERDLLIDHLVQKKMQRLENVLRGLAAHDRSGHLRIIWRGISSADSRRRIPVGGRTAWRPWKTPWIVLCQ
jgi:ATP/ADP translocase